MGIYSLNISYSCFKNIYNNIQENFHCLQSAFASFCQDFCQGKAIEAYIYGGSESGCVCLNFLKSMEHIHIKGVIDRFGPHTCFSPLSHVNPDTEVKLNADAVFVSTAPRHYQVIQDKIRELFEFPVDIVFMYSADDQRQNLSFEQEDITEEYRRILSLCRKLGVQQFLIDKYEKLCQGEWRDYGKFLLRMLTTDLTGKEMVDFGCGSGVLLPLLKKRGIARYIGIEDSPGLVSDLRRIFAEQDGGVDFALAEQGYLPLQPESLDLVIMNEVISHINPGYLDTSFAEVQRILRPGGLLFIGDSNNLACEGLLPDHLASLYEAAELGMKQSRGHNFDKPYMERRKEIIKKWFPEIDNGKLDFAAANTFRLYGEYLRQVVANYLETGNLARRPFIKGFCPVDPDHGYQVCERGFFPRQIMLHLESYGFKCRSLYDETELKLQKNIIIMAQKNQ